MTVPVLQAVGTLVSSTGAAVSPAWPTHQSGDVGFLILSMSGNSADTSAPSNWTELCDIRDINTTAGQRFMVYWRRATSAAMAAPTTDSGTDNCGAVIVTVRGALPAGTPIDVSAEGGKGSNYSTSASTTATMPAVTTTVADCLILWFCGRPDDSASTTHFGTPSNATTTGEDSTNEFGWTDGNGGGFVVAFGTMASAGDTGTTTMTKTASTTDVYLTVAVPPPLLKSVAGADRATITSVGGQAIGGVRTVSKVS